MGPGRELDKLIEENVMKKPFHEIGRTLTSYPAQNVPRTPDYSTNENDAQLVWDKMAELCPSETYDKFLEYMPSFRASEVKRGAPIKFPKQFVPPEEICIAALKALGIDNAR